MVPCPFCKKPKSKAIEITDLSIAFLDEYPVSLGHTLIVPHRHIQSFFELSQEESRDILEVVQRCQVKLQAQYSPTGYNLGINDGISAGQTILHVHLHLIPRYEGDCSDPRGGIRWVIPKKAAYWEK